MMHIVIFSAHGVSQAVRENAKQRGLKVFDATCPLVTKVHMEVTRASRKGIECILIGHAGHPEVEGTMGQYDNAGRWYLSGRVGGRCRKAAGEKPGTACVSAVRPPYLWMIPLM